MQTKKLSLGLRHIVAKSGQNGEQTWLPLWMHATDTAGVLEWLIDNWLPESVWKVLENAGRRGRMTRKEIRKLVLFLGYIHDVGKINPYFSCLITKRITEALEQLKEDGVSILPWEQYQTSGCNHAYISEIVLLSYGCPKGFASIVGSHHGMTQQINDDIVEAALYEEGHLKKNLYGENAKQWKQLRQEFFEWALEKAGYTDISDIPELFQKGQILLTGLLIMADWIASNTTYFPLLALSEEGSDKYYPQRVEEAMDERVNLPESWESMTYCMDEETFKEEFGFFPRPAQLDFIRTIEELTDMEEDKPGIFILEAPMGIGKTEAALAGAQLLANKTSAGGIFFGLPTQATANGIFERVIPWAQRQSEDSIIGYSVRLAHGMADFDTRYRGLFEGNSEIAEDESEENRLYAHTWFKGKKQALLADFVVGTVDQLLMSSLKKKHVMLRHLGMASKIAILDECHAYDVYTSEYLDRTLTWMGVYGQPVIILSATLPSKRRRQLIAAYLDKNVEEIPKEVEDHMGYPLLTYSAGEKVLQRELASKHTQNLVTVESLERENLAEFLKVELKDGGCVAVILNTVQCVQEMAQYLRTYLPNKEILELHSRYIYPDRKDKEDELIRRMGKKSTAKERDGCILVASQVAEQSLDFDADILVTELCPVDLLLQRMGREHRHQIHNVMRPSNLSTPRCIILREGNEVYSKGSKAVYGEYILMRTQAVLPKQIAIPTDIPMLVQKVYADAGEVYETIAGYQKAKNDYLNQQAEKRSKASNFLLSKPMKHEGRRESCMDQWLKNSTWVNDKVAEASVRDGEPSLEVLVLQRREGKIAFLPWQDRNEVLNENEVPSQEIGMKIAKQRLRLPRSLCQANKLSDVIKELEAIFKANFDEWKKSPWINGELILILDDNLSATLGGVKLKYSREDGLVEIKKQEESDGRNRI